MDLECRKCGAVLRDVFLRKVPKRLIHCKTAKSRCTGVMEQVFLPRPRNAGWSDKDAVVVFRKPDGSISYPSQNNCQTPKGCERITMRSLREVESFEKQNGVRCEAMHYNSGNGAELLDHIDVMPSLEKRQDAFLKAWHGQ